MVNCPSFLPMTE